MHQRKPRRVVLGEGYPQFLKRFVDDQQLIGLYSYEKCRNMPLFNQSKIHRKKVRLVAEILDPHGKGER